MPATFPSEPMSSAEFVLPDLDRVTEITRRHRLIADALQNAGLSAVLLEHPDNLAWFTAGGNFRLGSSEQTTAALFITGDARVVVCSNPDTYCLFQHTLSGFGFQLKERSWTEPRAELLADLCRGRQVGSDMGFPRTIPFGPQLSQLKGLLAEFEIPILQEAGRIVSHAVEATCRNLKRGRTEAELAGELCHRMLKREVYPVRWHIAADGRSDQCRHWGCSGTPVERFCTIFAVGRYRGLHVGVARTVCLGDPPERLWASYQKLAMIHGAAMCHTQARHPVNEVWNRVKRIYEKVDVEEEWRLADQGCILGYDYPLAGITPHENRPLQPGMAVFWHPSVGPAMSGDTVLVLENNAERVTPYADWPTMSIEVRNQSVNVPGILALELP